MSKIIRRKAGENSKGSHEIVSNNSKTVLFGLFALIGFSIVMYSAIVVAKYNENSINSTKFTNKNAAEIVNDQHLREQRNQQLEQLNTVYIAAISGSLALGGTLIAQLWGRSTNTS